MLVENLADHSIADVDSNPGEFSEAYWEINALRVYTP